MWPPITSVSAGVAPFVVDRGEFRAGHGLQHFHVQVAGRAGAEGPVVERAGFLLGERDQILHALDRHRRMQDQRVVDDDEPGDRREAFERIIGQPLVEARVDRERHLRADHQGVAVRRRLGDVFRGELIVGARAMLDHDLAAPGFREALRKDAAEAVDDAARRRRRHQRHRPRRIVLRVRCGRAQHRHTATGHHQCTKHDVIVPSCPALLRTISPKHDRMRLLRRPCGVRMRNGASRPREEK